MGGAPTARGSTPLVIVAAHRRPPDFGAFLHPCNFPTTAPSVVEKKIKTAPTKRILIALLALSSFILRDETDGKKIFFLFSFQNYQKDQSCKYLDVLLLH